MTWEGHIVSKCSFFVVISDFLGPAQRVVDGETIFRTGAQLRVPWDWHRHNKLGLSDDENHDDNELDDDAQGSVT